ncbi:hypothetical protein HYZ64_02400 [Candidatus Berkelbacteria bacterium]|nr:hypothetical protein [Candidatus Berkelbacteria bacterium]
MEEYIYLEPDEEIPTLLSKLKKNKSSSVGLVVPRGSITLQSAINLKLLKQEAAKLGKDIAIVTADSIGQHLAAQAGLTVFESVKSKEPIAVRKRASEEEKLPSPAGVNVRHFQTETIEPEKEYVEPERSHAPVPARRRVKGAVVVAIALVILLLYIFVVPRVTITVEVLGEPLERELTLTAATVSGAGEQVVPATLEEATKEQTQTFKTTGQKNVGEKAKGTIALNNAWSSDAVPLAAGTKLTKDGVAFRLTQAVTIPGATVSLVAGQAQTNPGKIDGAIEAEGSGEAGNVGPGKFTITSIEVIKQSKIYGESTAKLTGGSSRFIGVVSEEDLKTARTTLEGELKNELKESIVSKAAGRIVLDQAVKLEQIDEKASKQVDEEAGEFELKLKGNLKAIVFTEEDFRKAFLTDLGQEIGQDHEVVFGPSDEITTTVEEADFENGRLQLRGLLKSQIAPKIDQSQLKQAIRFKSFPGTEKIIRDLPQVSNVEISISPRLALKRIPLLPTNVKFDIKHK